MLLVLKAITWNPFIIGNQNWQSKHINTGLSIKRHKVISRFHAFVASFLFLALINLQVCYSSTGPLGCVVDQSDD